MSIYVKKLHSLYKLCKSDFVVEDIKLQRSPLQNSNFVITLASVGFDRSDNVCAVFYINICCFISVRNNSKPININLQAVRLVYVFRTVEYVVIRRPQCPHDVILLIGPTSTQSVSVKSLAVKTASKMTYIMSQCRVGR